jgi:microcystin degradation protein MlrC
MTAIGASERGGPRIAVLGLSHETNTFCVAPTDLAAFEREGVLRGEDIWARHATAHTTLAGFWEAGQRTRADLVPLVWYSAIPAGTIARVAFERMLGDLLGRLREGGPWDGVLLALHGAAVADGFPDADGEIARRVRALVGPGVRVGLALDMHANVSPLMVDSVDITTVYRTNPHVDPRERAAECGELLVRAIRGEIRPVQALVQVPAAINITRQDTSEAPMSELVAEVERVLGEPGVLHASVAEGYPYADVPEMGMTALVVADGDAGVARRHAEAIAARAWSRRAEFGVRALPPDAALRAAAAGPHPALVLDVGDNIGGGGPGDSTVLLDAAQRLGIRDVLVILVDPAAVAACRAAGVGGEVTREVGGAIDARYCRPVRVRGHVRVLSDGRWEEPQPTHGGTRFFDAGPTAVLDTTDGHTLILVSKPQLPSSLEQLRAVGLEPGSFAILTAKGVISPRAGYERVTRATYAADTPGVTAADLSILPYERRRRPLFPFEPEAALETAPNG